VVFGSFADRLIETLRPRRVLDVGCALGFLVEALRDRGVDAWGVDISQYAIDNVRPDVAMYCWVGSASEHIGGGPYDLIVCVEVLEHMPEPEAARAIEQMAALSDTVLFSSTPSDFAEPTHVNVQSLSYWIRSFAKRGFTPDLEFDASFVVSHAMLFRRSERRQPDDVIRTYVFLLEARQQIVNRDNLVNELLRDSQQTQAQLQTAFAEAASLSSQLSQSRVALATVDANIPKLAAGLNARDTTITELRSQLDQYSRRVVILQLDLANACNRTETAQAELEALRSDHAKLLTRTRQLEAELMITRAERDQSEAAHQQIWADLEVATTELSACVSGGKALVDHSELRALSDQLRLLEYRLRTVEVRTVDIGLGLDAVTKSKIWRTLVKAAGIALKLRPGRGHE
jgi:SAM-dependent methyltransferase